MSCSHAAFLLALAFPVSTLGAGVTFSYDPESPVGPAGWKDIEFDALNPNECDGDENSPIAIEDMGCVEFEDYIMRSGSCTNSDVEFEVNNHGVKATFVGECERPTLEIPGVEGLFEALQFHIHTGSEHTVDGVTFGAEMHIVHQMRDCPKGTERCFAVVGTKLNPASSKHNPLFSIFLEGWIKIHNNEELRCKNMGNFIDYDTVTENHTLIDPYQFNRESRFFHYKSGLTTPPCTEMVWWNLDDTPLAISTEQYIDLGRIILDYKDKKCNLVTIAHHGSTSRPTLPINGRAIKKICPKASAPNDTSVERSYAETSTSCASEIAVTISYVAMLAILATILQVG